MGKTLCFLLAMLLLPACATVNNSTVDHFRIDSVPQGASVMTTIEAPRSKRARKNNPELKPVYLGCEPTPCAIPVSRRSRFIATVSHEGYEPADIFISSSSSQGAFAGNMVATTATTAGTTAAAASMTAAMAAVYAEIASVILTSYVNVATFGAVPISTSAVTTASTSSVMASAVPPALIVSGSMLLIDAASGANKNLFPNPVILGLAPQGRPSKIDPFVLMYREELGLKETIALSCKGKGAFDKPSKDRCTQAKKDLSANRQKQKKVMALVMKAQKEAAQSRAKAKTSMPTDN